MYICFPKLISIFMDFRPYKRTYSRLVFKLHAGFSAAPYHDAANTEANKVLATQGLLLEPCVGVWYISMCVLHTEYLLQLTGKTEVCVAG